FLTQSIFHPFKTASLSGFEPTVQADNITLTSLSDDIWKRQITKQASREFGFRAFAVRLFNQANYSLFGEGSPYVEEVKDGYLFEKSYRAALCGKNFVGLEKIESQLDSLLMLDARLKARGKSLIVLLAPN